VHVWLVHVGEQLPSDGDVRPLRYGLLTEALLAAGHRVTRWAPTFNHARKRQRFSGNRTLEFGDRYRVKFLFVEGYTKNVSLARLRFYRRLARAYARQARAEVAPDLILCAVPSPEMCEVSVRLAKELRVPVLIDVRDLWPDSFLSLLPEGTRWLGRLPLLAAFRRNSFIFRQADAVWGISASYLAWGLRYANRPRRPPDRVVPLAYKPHPLSEAQFARERARLLEAGVRPEAMLCCYFGQFGASYDLETVLCAARLLEGQRVQFVLCGEGRKEGALRAQAASLTNVVFLGWVGPTTLTALMRMAEVGLAPYTRGAPQGLPNKPIEYLSGGLLVLSSLRGELEGLLSDGACGLTYEAGDAKGLARALEGLLEDVGWRRQLRANARHVFARTFMAERVYGEAVRHLEHLAREVGAGRAP